MVGSTITTKTEEMSIDFHHLESNFYKQYTAETICGEQLLRLSRRILDFLSYFTSRFSPVMLNRQDDASTRTRRDSQPVDYHGIYLESSISFAKRCSPLRRLVIYTCLLAMFLEFAYTLCCDFVGKYWEQSYREWEPRIKPGAKMNGNCVLRDDIQLNLSIGYQRYLQSSHLKDAFGLQALSEFTRSTSGIFIFRATGWFIVFVSTFRLYQGSKLRISALSFMLNPRAERARTRNELGKVMIDCCPCPIKSKHHRGIPNAIVQSRDQSKHDSRKRRETYAQIWSGTKRQTKKDFALMLAEENIAQLVSPRSLCNCSLNSYLGTILVVFVIGIQYELVLSTMAFVRMLRYHIEANILECKRQVQCESWHPNAQLIKTRLDFLDPFWTHNGHLYGHQNTSELTLYGLEIQRAGCWALTIVTLWWLFFLLGPTIRLLHYVIVASSYHFQRAWLADVTDQLNQVNSMMICYRDKQQQHCIDRQSKKLQQAVKLKAIHKAMAVTYLNFELFRRQYSEFLSIARHIVGVTIVESLTRLTVIYFLFSNNMGEIDRRDMIRFIAILLIYVNVIFIKSAGLVVQIEGITAKLLRVLARASDMSITFSHITKLWRRQLLNSKDIRTYYAISVLGFELSQENLITLDSYLLAVALIAYNLLGSLSNTSPAGKGLQ